MATTATHRPPRRRPARARPTFGTFLSNMVMPNIGAIIAWGLITAFFIPVGWTPNEKIATIVGPGIYYLLPLLIAYTGGYNVYKHPRRRRRRDLDARRRSWRPARRSSTRRTPRPAARRCSSAP